MPAIALLLLLANGAANDAILGQWRGKSTCVKIEMNRYCNDEDVQYTFTREGDVYKLKAEKVLFAECAEMRCTDVYAEMYRMDFRYDAAAKAWSADFSGPRAHGVWSYTIDGDGDEMKGICTSLPSKTVVRHVLVHRYKP